MCAGDLVGYGANIGAVIEVFSKRGIPCVMGNYDEAIGFGLPSCGCHINNPEQKRLSAHALRWAAEHTTLRDREFLRALPERLELTLSGKRIVVVHATPDSITDYVYGCDEERIAEITGQEVADVYIYGHTHYPYTRTLGETVVINPGSVGRPKDGDNRASYAMLDIQDARMEISFYKVSCEVEAAAQELLANGIDAYFADFLLNGGTPERAACGLGEGCGCDV